MRTRSDRAAFERRLPAAALWVVLFVLLALVTARVGALIGGAPGAIEAGMAQAAELVSQTGGLTVLSTDGGNEDLLVVLDGRNEEMFVYRTDINAGIQLLQRYTVPQLFTDARARSLGRK